MTEDILFDNIYIGHSVEDAKKFAAETFEIKKPLEVAESKTAVDDEEEQKLTFKEDPVGFLRTHVVAFMEAARENPVGAVKAHPQTGAALAVGLFTLFGMLGALVGIIGGAQKPVVTKVRANLILRDWMLIFLSVDQKDGDTVTGERRGRSCFLCHRFKEG